MMRAYDIKPTINPLGSKQHPTGMRTDRADLSRCGKGRVSIE